MKFMITAVATLGVSMTAMADVNEVQTENHPIEFVLADKSKSSEDALAVKIEQIQSQTDINVDEKINEVELLVTQINSKDDELSQLIKKLEVKQVQEKKKAQLIAKRKAEAAKKTKEAKQYKAKQFTATGNSPLSFKSRPMVAARKATRNSHSSSKGLCAKYVRIALQAAGYKFTPNPSAYMYASRGTLRKAGFVKINNKARPQIGDVAVVSRSRAHPHGHISIYNGKHWVSDFRQNNKNPYKQYYSYTVWRDAGHLNGASAKGLYMASK